jgi:hypothetical protein
LVWVEDSIKHEVLDFEGNRRMTGDLNLFRSRATLKAGDLILNIACSQAIGSIVGEPADYLWLVQILQSIE